MLLNISVLIVLHRFQNLAFFSAEKGTERATVRRETKIAGLE